MQAVNYSNARNNLKSLINDVCNNYEHLIITNKDGKNVVMMSLEEFNSIQETLYLMASSVNRDRLLKGIEQVEKGLYKEIKID